MTTNSTVAIGSLCVETYLIFALTFSEYVLFIVIVVVDFVVIVIVEFIVGELFYS